MVNKIESEFTTNRDLISQYTRRETKSILISTVISVATSLVFYYHNLSMAIILVVIGELVIINFRVVENKLIDIRWINDTESLEITYFNLLDKIVTERIEKIHIRYIKHNANKRFIMIELTDYRLLKTHYAKDQAKEFGAYNQTNVST